MKKNIYFALAGIGFIFPYYFLFLFIRENGLNVSLLLQQLFTNPISTFFAVDLIISIIVFWVYLYQEIQTHKIKNSWIYVVASLLVGLSFALPLFLYARERQLMNQPK
ncbi:MAG: DUF2834 domain-containing protein [Anaerolineales bacterium]